MRPPGPRAVVTVTTLKDDLPNVRRFIDDNVAAGVDHLVVFLDGEAPDVAAHLRDHPRVTFLRTGRGYWGDQRPDNLNRRQRINATRVLTSLAWLGWDAWLCHVDGDEVVQLDRDALFATRAEYVVLRPLEAVSVAEQGRDDVRSFKRLLTPGELELLVDRGVLAQPDNRRYFRGYVNGKLAIRPRADVVLDVHDLRPRGAAALGLAHDAGLPGMHVLHYDCFGFEEFIRKWLAHDRGVVTPTYFRDERDRTRLAVQEAFGRSAPEEEQRRQARTAYDAEVADDVELLAGLGLLVPAPRTPGSAGSPLPPRETRMLRRLLVEMARLDRRYFELPGWRPREQVRATVLSRVDPASALAERLRGR